MNILFYGLIFVFCFRYFQVCKTEFFTCTYIEQRSVTTIKNSSFFLQIREKVSKLVRSELPSPHSELLLGVTVGINDLKMVPMFNDVVKSVGLIHVIVVSGYNINLVFAIVYKLIGNYYNKLKLIIAIIIATLYAGISGFEPPVLRALLMGILVIYGKSKGLSIDISWILIISALFFLVLNPTLLYSLSFQLSFLATLSLILYSSVVDGLFIYPGSIFDDFKATFAAQILVWPLLAYYFGNVSTISVISNAVLLWVIPLITIYGGLYIILLLLHFPFVGLFSDLMFIVLDIFVIGSNTFSKFKYATIPFKISIEALLLYYFCCFLVLKIKGSFTQ